MRFATLTGCLFLLGGMVLPFPQAGLWAADAPPEHALDLARLELHKSLLEASLNPLKKHLTQLAELEKTRAEGGDYAGAIEARNLRKRLTTELERLDKELLLAQTREQSLRAALLPERITLALDSAVYEGGVRLEGGMLTGWTRPGASARWKLPDLPPGGYEVVMRFRCGALEGGSFLVEESRFNLQAEVYTTQQGPQEKNLGTLKITDGKGALTIRVRTLVKDNLMQLQALYLVPSSRS